MDANEYSFGEIASREVSGLMLPLSIVNSSVKGFMGETISTVSDEIINFSIGEVVENLEDNFKF